MWVISSGAGHRQATTQTGGWHCDIDPQQLQQWVAELAFPRHFFAEQHANRQARGIVVREFQRLGLSPSLQGEATNVVATLGVPWEQCRVIVGAHYDSVPRTPGADDNASAVAGMLAVAKALQPLGPLPVAFVAFNQEEDGMVGSQQLVAELRARGGRQLVCAHVLEMIGYCSHEPGSQHLPVGLPIRVSNVGNFIGVIANRRSNAWVAPLVALAERRLPELPVKALKVFAGMERLFPHLLRSDHGPFWRAGLPALMWTDTAEFRNPHYHRPSDLPDTLDYQFMAQVATLLTYMVRTQCGWEG